MKTTFKELRLASGLSQMKLAKKLGVTQVAVSMWERGVTKPDIINALSLSKVFRVSVNKVISLYL